MVFCNNNLITESNTTVNGEISAFAKGNMLADQLAIRTYFDNYIDIDFGSALSIDSIGLISDDIAYKLMGNSVNDFDNAPFIQYVNSKLSFISQAYRYWRLTNDIGSNIDFTSSGTDRSLTSPDSNFNTPTNFIPMNTVSTDIDLYIGDGHWRYSGGATSGAYLNDSDPIGTYGQIKFVDALGSNWNSFASSSNDGRQKITLPQLANGDSLGGDFYFYFLSAAFNYAFNGNTLDCIVTQNESTYKGSVSNSNLVVRFDGKTGPAGSATPDVLEDIPNPSGEDKINYFFMGNKLIIPDPIYGEIPKRDDNDIVNESASGQEFSLDGVQKILEQFDHKFKTKAEKDLIEDFTVASYRNKAGIFAQTESNLTLFPPYFAKIKINFAGRSTSERYDFSTNVREVK